MRVEREDRRDELLPLVQPAMEVTRRSAVVPYRVRFDEATPAGTLRTSVLLRYAQDVAWVHSEALGFDRRWYAERGLAWLVRSAELRILGPMTVGETLHVRTQVTGTRKVWARRRTEVRRWAGDDGTISVGELVAWLHTDWVMTDARGAPARVPSEIPTAFGISPEPFAPVRVDLPGAPADALRGELPVRRHELDPMGHANNAAYLDWAEDVAAGVLGGDPSAARAASWAQLEYLLPAHPSDMLVVEAWPDAPNPDDDGTIVAVRMQRADPAGVHPNEVLRARLRF